MTEEPSRLKNQLETELFHALHVYAPPAGVRNSNPTQ